MLGQSFLRVRGAPAVTAVLVAVTAAAVGCTSTAAPAATGPGGPIAVTAADTSCSVGANQAAAGTIRFAIANVGTKITEFYLYGTGDRILGEVENIGPGLTRLLTVEVPDGGTYTTACKPGMLGEGIRAPFTVTGSAIRSTDRDSKLAEATRSYTGYVAAQVDALVARTADFAAAVKKGDVAAAKALYPVARTYYERIEPVSESFADLDPLLDGREDAPRDPGVAWAGFHRLEKDLWVSGLQTDSAAVADRLAADTRRLQARVPTLAFTPTGLAGGAKTLLDEVATGKVTGEEDRYSHTDLWDLRGNLEGSQAAVAALRPVIDGKDPALGPRLDARFAAVADLLARHRVGEGYQLYTQLAPAEVKALAVAVDALAEPVSTVAGVVAG